MPWKLKHVGGGKAYVVTKETGKKHSDHPLPLATAKKQLAVLNMKAKKGEIR